MDNHSLEFFYTRTRNEALHDHSIRNDTGKISNDLSMLVDSVFGHLPAHYGDKEPPSYPEKEDEARRSVPSIEWMSWKLYNENYCTPELRLDHDGVAVNDTQFLDRLSTFHSTKNRNQLFFLQGEIGCGKTSFINYLITKYSKRCFESGSLWFLRLNVDVAAFVADKTPENFYVLLLSKISTVLSKLAQRDEIPKTVNKTVLSSIRQRIEHAINHNDKDLKELARRTIAEVSEALNCRPLIILDNLDFYFHERDRYIFLSDSDTGEHPFIGTIQTIVNSFFHGQGQLGDLGANVLFVLRQDSYVILKASRTLFKGVEDNFTDNKSLFTLRKPDWNNVIKERGSLLQKSIDEIRKDGLKKSAIRSLSPVLEALGDTENVQELISHLKEIVPFGLRSVMAFLKRYVWLQDTNLDETKIRGTTRYIEHFPVGLLAFMLDNRRLYSQKVSNFPNIFLCNIEAEETLHIQNEIQGSITNSVGFNNDHRPSYWLKMLLLGFISRRNQKGVTVNTSEVIRVFAQEPVGYYSPSLVRLCLGSFTQTHGANLLEVKRNLSNDRRSLVVESVALTPRARHCLEKIFTRFYYLQLVVDDYALPLPKSEEVSQRFMYDPNFHYGYLVADSKEYVRLTRQMIQRKAFLVLDFLALLAASYEMESKRFFRTFELLGKEKCLPNSSKTLLEEFLHEMTALNWAIGGGTDSIVSIEKLRTRYATQFIEMRRSIESAFL